jgi:hypothetical protein
VYSERCEDVARQSVMSIGKSLVLKSPVGDATYWKHKPPKGYVGGRFRANWQYGVNITPTGTTAKIDRNGTATIAAMNSRIEQAEAMGVVHVFTNNLPYAVPLEYGHSRQAPQGMVRLTAAEFGKYVEDAVAKAKAKQGAR